MSARSAACLLAVVALASGRTQAQDMPVPKPGPEHRLFQEDVGTWDASLELFGPPGTPPMTSRGVETNTVGCSGLCLVTDFKGEMMPGLEFHGHGTTSWDPAKKKYVGSWTDSWSTGLSLSEATYDPAGKTLTGSMEGPDMTGRVTKSKTVVQYKDGGRVMSMYQAGPDGKEALVMKITYTRKK